MESPAPSFRRGGQRRDTDPYDPTLTEQVDKRTLLLHDESLAEHGAG